MTLALIAVALLGYTLGRLHGPPRRCVTIPPPMIDEDSVEPVLKLTPYERSRRPTARLAKR